MIMRLIFLIGIALGWLGSWLPASAAEIAADARAGGQLARYWCAGCHVVADDQRRPAVAGVPTFRGMANDPAVTEYRIRMFLMTPHTIMPNFMLTRRETDDIVAYIQSLKDKPKK
jgi:mono/diheme cytochrome c family protein